MDERSEAGFEPTARMRAVLKNVCQRWENLADVEDDLLNQWLTEIFTGERRKTPDRRK